MATEAEKRAVKAYKERNIKRVPLDMQISYYTDVFLPSVKDAGISVNTYIKQAINEKIEREIVMTKREILNKITEIIAEADKKADEAQPSEWMEIHNKAYEDAKAIALKDMAQGQFDLLWNKAVDEQARKMGIRKSDLGMKPKKKKKENEDKKQL